MSLSVVVHTKNAASTLAQALKSVAFADEIIVVDMESQDETLQIAANFEAQIFKYQDLGFADPARNFGLSQASHDWILVLDADEEVPATLRDKIQEIIADKTQETDAYYLPRKNIIFNRWIEHTGWWPDYQIRLFKRGQVSWTDQVHRLPDIKGEAAHLPADERWALVHHNYPSVESFINRLNRYTTIKADELHKADQAPHIPDTFFTTFGQEFLRRYFAQQGYLDGGQGISLALLQAMYELVVQLKVWEAQGFPSSSREEKVTLRALQHWQQDLKYWIADWHCQRQVGLGRIWWQIRRKLRI